MDNIRVQTQNRGERVYKADKKITSKHWKIYYQLMSLSKYNAQKRENHRYIYKKDLNIAKLCRETGIKSNKTFYNAIERLSEWGLVQNFPDYFLLYAPNYVEISKQTLITLLNHIGTEVDHIDLLRTYLILKKMDKLAMNQQDRTFTLRMILTLLGGGTTTPSYYERLRFYLGMLSYWGLITITVTTEHNEQLGVYKKYYLVETKETELSEDFIIGDYSAESCAPLGSEEMMEKLKFIFPNILEN